MNQGIKTNKVALFAYAGYLNIAVTCLYVIN